ncbi:hypothetical protein KAR91_29950, partial [Candidatus Pacearchaeota archaeon]|nr:hypothetical protein [Candidatus Pacearchaeota archaeon]
SRRPLMPLGAPIGNLEGRIGLSEMVKLYSPAGSSVIIITKRFVYSVMIMLFPFCSQDIAQLNYGH